MVVRAALLLATAVLGTACSSAPAGGSHPAPSSSPPTSPGLLRLTQDFTFIPQTKVAQLQVWAGSAAWIALPGAGQSSAGERIEVLDFKTHTERTLVTLPHDRPLASMTGDGDTVIYVELMGRPDFDHPLTDWQMNAVSLKTGASTTVAASAGGQVNYLLVPRPTLRMPILAWAEPISVPLGQRVDSKVIAANLQTHRQIVLDTASGAQQIAVVGPTVVYESGRAPDYTAHDIYARPADGSTPVKRLTTNTSSRNPLGGGSWIGWEQPGSEGTAIFAGHLTTAKLGAPVEIDPSSQDDARMGDSFIVWLAASGALVLQPVLDAGVGQRTTVNESATLDQAGSWDARGNKLAWVRKAASGQQIVVASVDP